MKNIPYILFTILLTLASCSTNGRSFADNHLGLIKANKLREANLQYCFPTVKLWLHNLGDYKIISSEEKSVPESETPLYYTDVVAQIENSSQVFIYKGKTVAIVGEGRISIQVWKSDEFYQLYAKEQKTNTKSPPERSEVNKDDWCVYLKEDQIQR
ncbi:MAG: hypothetical protein ACK5RE_19245 [Pseudanabaena sp.]|jgi:hypothetical protein